jgi:hypothetical protein
MTPKEKAWDLNQKFIELQHYLENDAWNNSKQCALIAVDELIKWMPTKEFDSDPTTIYDVEYWYEVKKEIDAL